MAKSSDKYNVEYDINDDIIKASLKTELSSVKASDKLTQDTILKCEAEIEKQTPQKRFILSKIVKMGAPVVAGALVLLIMFMLPGGFNSNKSSDVMPQGSGPSTASSINNDSVKNSLEAAPEAPIPAPSAEEDISIFSRNKMDIRPSDEALEFGENIDGGAGALSGEKERNGGAELFSMRSEFAQQEVNEFSVFFGELFFSLNNSGTDDYLINMLNSVLGEPSEESIEVLDESADSHKGVTVRTMKYDGLTVAISGIKTYYISSIEFVNEKYTTNRGIAVGMSVDDLKAEYENIPMALDGRTNPNYCAYLLMDGDYFLRFEVEEGIITQIKYYAEIG